MTLPASSAVPAWRDHPWAANPTWPGEWPTWLVAAAVYGGWGVVTLFYDAFPWWAVLALGAWLVAWHNSLQHEALHGHPTSSRWINTVLAMPPLGLWMPYPVYRETHLRHHDAPLTCPFEDPESYYVDAERWRRMGAGRRAVLIFNNTLLGRLTIGPALAAARFWRGEARRIAAGDSAAIRVWLGHAAAVAAVLYWVVAVCGIPLHAYVLLIAYPGLSLTLMRSYLEHRPAAEEEQSTVIVEGGPVAGLLYLNNDLHAAHHRWPGLAWYLLPAAYAAERASLLGANGGYLFPGYGALARRHLLRPKDLPLHPG